LAHSTVAKSSPGIKRPWEHCPHKLLAVGAIARIAALESVPMQATYYAAWADTGGDGVTDGVTSHPLPQSKKLKLST